MTKEPASCGRRSTALGQFLILVFMFGCGSTSQPERPIQVVAKQESLPEAKTQS